MRSVAITIKKLPPHLISQAKLQILTLVTNLQTSSDGSQATASRGESSALLLQQPYATPSNNDSSCIIQSKPDAYMTDTESYALRYS